MALENFQDKITKITHTWLNKIDVVLDTILDQATTKAEARTALDVYSTTEANALVDDLSGVTNTLVATRNLEAAIYKDTKAQVAALALTSADAGRAVHIAASDGGWFVVEYNATPGTYADDGGSYCGTQFIPSGGDGTIGIVRDYSGAVDAKWFGANESSSDNATAIQAALDSSSNDIHVLITGDFICGALSITGTRNVTLEGRNGSLLSTGLSKGYDLITASSTINLTVLNLEIDGSDILQRAVITSGNLTVHGCYIHNLYTDDASAMGIQVLYGSVTSKSALISHNRITDFAGITTGSIGDGAGSTRAIYAESPSSATAACRIVIRDNFLDNFFAREGDVIQCVDSLTSGTSDATSTVLIESNYIGRANRRHIKVQGNNVSIKGNLFETIDTNHAEWGNDGQGGAGIITVSGNSGQTDVYGIEIDDNTFINNGGVKISIYLYYQNNISIRNNTHFNKIDSPLSSDGFISVNGNNDGVFVIGNHISGTTTCVAGGATDANVVFDSNSFFMQDGIRSIFDSISAFPDAFIFANNIIQINSSSSSGFLGAFHFSGSTTVTGSEVEISNNMVISESPTAGRGGLCWLGSSSTLTGVAFIGNKTNSTSMFLNFASVTDISGCLFKNNMDSTGASLPPVVLGKNMITNPYFTSGVTGWTSGVHLPTEEGLEVISSTYASQTGMGLTATNKYALITTGRIYESNNTAYCNIIIGSNSFPVDIREGAITYFTHAGADSITVDGTNALTDMVLTGIEIRPVV